MKTKKTMQVTNNAVIERAERAELGASETKQKPKLGAREFEAMKKATGARSDEVATMLLLQSHSLLSQLSPTDATTRQALGMLGEMEPRNVTEGMLAVQMIGVHEAAVAFLRDSRLPNQTHEGADLDVARALRLMRLFTDQLEAMAKLKGTAGRQKMTVEHVHVHAGGQAIVGPVARGNGPAGDEGGAK